MDANGRRRSGLWAAVVAATLTLAAAPSAGAAIQIGETFVTNQGCSPNVTNLQSASPGNGYAAPAGGVITSWSYMAPNTTEAENPDQLKLKIGRAAGGNQFVIVAESAPAVPILNKLNTFPAQIPVQAGDLLGFVHQNAPGNAACSRAAPGFNFHYALADVPPGQPTTFTPGLGSQLNVSATLETTTCGSRAPTIAGTTGPDQLNGTSGPDVIVGLEGNDRVNGLGGNDFVCGGQGKDTVRGGPGKDRLFGEQGKDKLLGGGGKDICKGQGGRDSATTCERTGSL